MDITKLTKEELKNKLDEAERWLNNNSEHPAWDDQFNKFRKALKHFGNMDNPEQLKLES